MRPRAARGEPLTVTDRGKPREVLGPLSGGDTIARGIAEGWITAAPAPGPLPSPPTRARASVSVQDMIDEDRAEE